jgi:hypothetical protein
VGLLKGGLLVAPRHPLVDVAIRRHVEIKTMGVKHLWHQQNIKQVGLVDWFCGTKV